MGRFSLNSVHTLVLAGAAALLAVGCSPSVSNSPVASFPPTIDGMTPTEIRANYTGDVSLTGSGFEGADWTANFHPLTSLPGVTLTVVDGGHATIHFAYGGAGTEIPPGFYQITAKNSRGEANAPDVLHVKTFLAEVSWVRTLALPFTVSGGTASFFVRPDDFSGEILYPGHQLVGTAGVPASDFSWQTTSITAVGSTTALPLPVDSIGAASFQFLGEGSSKPLSITIAIDQSGSMHGLDGNPPSDPNDERVTQTEAFVASLGAADEVCVYSFQGTSITKIVDFTTDKNAVHTALETLRTGVGGATPLYDTMAAAVAAEGARPATFSRATLVLTDGRDTNSTATPAQVIASAQGLEVPVFSIGLGNPNVPNSLDPVQMKVIADQTGGKVFLATDPSALQSVFSDLEGTLNSSYEVTADFAFGTALPQAGSYSIEGNLSTTVDGVTVTIPIPAFTVSVL
ncbi:MAG TPA: VWA domain-containing protein [bacterium]|nr:VWA domain-containing protein [bacterium]